MAHPRLYCQDAALATFRTNYADVLMDPWRTYLYTVTEEGGSWPTTAEPTSGADSAVPGYLQAEYCALAWLGSQATVYRDPLRIWADTVSAWDNPAGTAFAVADAQMDRARQFMRLGALVYDCMYGDFETTGQRDALRDAIAARAADFYTYLTITVPSPESWKSHAVTSVAYLADAAIALDGEVAGATDWLAFVIAYYGTGGAGHYPRWGGSDGGYSEGRHYYINGPLVHNISAGRLDAYAAAGILAGNPWFAKSFRQYMYLGYPHENYSLGSTLYQYGRASANSWGDSAAHDFTSQQGTRDWAFIASRQLANVQFRWWAENVWNCASNSYVPESAPDMFAHETSPSGRNLVQHRPDRMIPYLVDEVDDPMVGVAPSGISWPLSEYFADVGVVAMRTDLTDLDGDIVFAMKATPDPLTSVSHGHGDQLSIILKHRNSPLVIAGGVNASAIATSCGQTQYKSSLLFGGSGQYWSQFRTTNTSPTVDSVIEAYSEEDDLCYCVGEAHNAYTAVTVTQARRFAVLVRSGGNALPYCVTLDDTITPEAQTVTWVHMGSREMVLDSGARTIDHAFEGVSFCRVKILLPTNPSLFEQDEPFVGQSGYDSSDNYKGYGFEQWRTQVVLPTATTRRIVAIYMPYGPGESAQLPAAISGVDGGTTYTLTVGEDTLTFDLSGLTVALNVAPERIPYVSRPSIAPPAVTGGSAMTFRQMR